MPTAPAAALHQSEEGFGSIFYTYLLNTRIRRNGNLNYSSILYYADCVKTVAHVGVSEHRGP